MIIHHRGSLIQIILKIHKLLVIVAIKGLFGTSIPFLGGIFADLDDYSDEIPLEQFFDELYFAGQAIVHINMIILGANLIASYQRKKAKRGTTNDDDFTLNGYNNIHLKSDGLRWQNFDLEVFNILKNNYLFLR